MLNEKLYYFLGQLIEIVDDIDQRLRQIEKLPEPPVITKSQGLPPEIFQIPIPNAPITKIPHTIIPPAFSRSDMKTELLEAFKTMNIKDDEE